MFRDYSPAMIVLVLAATAFCFWLDLHAHGEDKPVSARSALLWSLIWTLVAIAFTGYLAYAYGRSKASLFFTGYVLERSLSVDNLFVFMAIFASFSVPDRFQIGRASCRER